MDAKGNSLPNSPYVITPLNQTSYKGLAKVVIPQDDLVNLTDQFLQYSVTGLKDGVDVIFYGDTRFGAVGKMELVGNAMPTFRDEQIVTSFFSDMSYDTISSENFHSSAIPVKFYEAVPTTVATLDFAFSSLDATVTVEATKDASISSESFSLRGTVLDTFSVTTNMISLTKNYSDLGEYAYIRISYHRTINNTGKITKVLVS